MKVILVAVPLAAAAVCLVMSWGGLQYVFEDYRDNDLGAYLLFAVFWWLIAGLLIWAAVLVARRGRG